MLRAARQSVAPRHPPRAAPSGNRVSWRRWALVSLCGVTILVLHLVAREFVTFEGQAKYLAAMGEKMHYRLEPGPNPALRVPGAGVFDRRLGYTDLPAYTARLGEAGYRVRAQARWSAQLEQVVDLGLNAPYSRKLQAGLTLLDRDGRPLHRARYPTRIYASFEDIPPLIVDTLLFIENRELLDPRQPYRNPAVEWDRLARTLALRVVDGGVGPGRGPGASTLATQLEKYQHAPEGRTRSVGDKLRQMASASLRAYLDGAETLPARRRIVTEFLNSVPLAAAPGHGEVHGLGDGLSVWFGADFQRVNALLRAEGSPMGGRVVGQDYRAVLSLLLAQRRPSHYLLAGRGDLDRLVDAYLRLMAQQGIVPGPLLEAALEAPVSWRAAPAPVLPDYSGRKWPYFVQSRLLALLGVPDLYALNRLDLSVDTTIDAPVQAAVERTLAGLSDPRWLRELNLTGRGLLQGGDPAGLIYSVTLIEYAGGMNQVRVQADNANRPLDINRGVKLDLGSTAKLRTLLTYLQAIADLHKRHAGRSPEGLARARAARFDPLGAWVLDYLRANPGASQRQTLRAAMARAYSANPNQRFFTGGGLHVFRNFDRDDDWRVLTVGEAFRDSVNLVFIRLMAEVVAYYQAEMPHSSKRLLEYTDSPLRETYLKRFADREGTEFLRRFHAAYAGLSPGGILERALGNARRSRVALATVVASVVPGATADDLVGLAGEVLEESLSPGEAAELLATYSPAHYVLNDRAYLANLHPLELWLAGALYREPGMPLERVLEVSRDERMAAYRWLFRTRSKRAQDRRIATLLEQEAFLDIHAFWQRLGYPFDTLVPSLASAIGSSADQPGALAELLGILVRGGVRYPTVIATGLDFAVATPYETLFEYSPPGPRRVLSETVAEVAREALREVVTQGTARRLKRLAPDMAPRIGGKTGTGDHRYERVGARGQVLESRVVNRAAVFTFLIDDRFFGTVTAFVPGEAAAGYRFTSALPVQLLGVLLPLMEPVLQRGASSGEAQVAQSGG